MKLFLISNNLVLEDIVYQSDEPLEQKRINRPLSIEGEKVAKKVAEKIDVHAIYSSDYASALATAKYVADKNHLPIYIDSNLRDAKIGELGSKNIKTLRLMQEKDFNYRFINGESINDTKTRLVKIIKSIISENPSLDIAIFTHKRAIMSYLTQYAETGYNLDDRLILTFNEEVIIDDAENSINIIELTIDDNKVIDIKVG